MKTRCSATCIGSFPYTSPAQAYDFLMSRIRDIPLWPQLPKRSFRESMYVQYSEGFPSVKIDMAERKIVFEEPVNADPERMERFLQAVMEDDLSHFAISPDYAAGLYCLAERRDEIAAARPVALKGHMTGPVSFALTVTDPGRRPLYFDADQKEILMAGLKMKAFWQIDFLKKLYDKILFFIDEPYLSGIGSGVISLNPREVREDLRDFMSCIKDRHPDVLLAVHCCGNTDWSLILNSGIDILSFDAWNYGESLLLYEKELKAFTESGGSLAWGVVPTSGDFSSVTLDALKRNFDALLEKFASRNFDLDKLLEQSLITPACGTGTLSVEEAEAVVSLSGEFSAFLKKNVL